MTPCSTCAFGTSGAAQEPSNNLTGKIDGRGRHGKNQKGDAHYAYRHGASLRGKARSEYRIWQAIKDRCLNSHNKSYEHYGGRGISVCPEWRDSFEIFFAYVGPRPTPKHSIDRIDNDKGYGPGNVRWATQPEQSRNTSKNRLIEIDGRRLCLTDWAILYGKSPSLVRARVRRGVDIRTALESLAIPRKKPAPGRPRKKPAENRRSLIIEYAGRRLNAKEWACVTGVCYTTIVSRIHRGGLTAEQILFSASQDRPQSELS